MVNSARVFIKGFVQGVGFRHFVKKEAQIRGLVGWVRNTPEGSVEVLIQGKKEAIDELIRLCKQGPFLSNVKGVDIQREKPQALVDFSIVA